jgi:hypothetical protein
MTKKLNINSKKEKRKKEKKFNIINNNAMKTNIAWNKRREKTKEKKKRHRITF